MNLKLRKQIQKIPVYKIQIKYLMIGIFFGILFPLFAWGYEFNSNNFSISKFNIIKIIEHNPMIIMISTAPFFLGLFSLYSGIQISKLESINRLLALEIETTKKVEQIAYRDSLTGLPNRIIFDQQINHAIYLSSRLEKSIAILFLDLDGFKMINDTMGHSIGDLMLIETAKRLVNTLRKCDIVSRIGGDEFVILIQNIENIDDISAVADKLIRSIKEPFVLEGQERFITASIGISIYPSDGETAENLTKNADIAMYSAKQKGKNQYVLYEFLESEQDVREEQEIFSENNLQVHES